MPVVCKHFLYTPNIAKEAKYCEIMQHKIVGETHGEAMDGDGVSVPLSHVLVAIWASIHARSGWFIDLERAPVIPVFGRCHKIWLQPNMGFAHLPTCQESFYNKESVDRFAGIESFVHHHSESSIIRHASLFVLTHDSSLFHHAHHRCKFSFLWQLCQQLLRTVSSFTGWGSSAASGWWQHSRDAWQTWHRLRAVWLYDKLVVAAETVWFFCKFHQCLMTFYLFSFMMFLPISSKASSVVLQLEVEVNVWFEGPWVSHSSTSKIWERVGWGGSSMRFCISRCFACRDYCAWGWSGLLSPPYPIWYYPILVTSTGHFRKRTGLMMFDGHVS